MHRPLLTRLTPLLLAAGLLLGLVGLGAAPAAAATDRRTDAPDVVAHRGSSGVAPENTIASLEVALRHRSDVLENDIQRTSDGVLILMHDTTLARTTDAEEVFPDRAPWNVGDFTLAEVKQLDAGSWFAPEFTGEQVPTLEEWLAAAGRRVGLLLEPKSPALYPGMEADLDAVLNAMPDYDRAVRKGRIVVQSFDHVWLRAYADLATEVPVGLLYGTNPTPADIDAAATWAEQVNPALGVTDEATVDLIHARGLETHVWTVNAGQDMRRAIAWDVDGIITNYPQVLHDILRHG